MTTKTCAYSECHNTFEPKRAAHRFCCPEHRRAEYRRVKARPSWRDEARTCRNCGRTFQPRVHNQVYCKADCRKAANARSREAFQVLERDGFRCVYCGASPAADPAVILHLDHVIPLSEGGLSTAGNLVTACAECNTAKATRRLNGPTEADILAEVARRNVLAGLRPSTVIRLRRGDV